MSNFLESKPVQGAVKIWRNSGTCLVLDKVGAGGGKLLRESQVWQLIRRDGILASDWADSRLCMVLSWALNLPGAVFACLRRKWPGAFENSFFLRLLTALGDRADLLLSLLLGLMLIAPHAVWNNLYTMLGVIAILGVQAFSRRPGSLKLDAASPGPWVALFLIGIVRAMLTVELQPIRLGYRFCAFHVTGMLLALTLVSTVDSYKKLRRLLWIVFLGITVASIYGCYQSYVGVEIRESQQDMALNAGMPGRIYSFFDNPNNFAELIVMTVPLGITLILNADSPRERIYAILCLLPCIASLGFTYSRSSWLGFVLAILVFCALWRWKLTPLLVLAGICCLPILPDTIVNRIMTIGNRKDTSSMYRVAIYESARRLIKDFWFGGAGLGSDTLYQVFKLYPTMYDGNWPLHCHNNFLQVWAEMGLFGIIPMIGLVVRPFRTGVSKLFKADGKLRKVLAASLGSFAGILLISMVEYTWYYPRNMFFFWFLIGIVSVCVKLIKNGEKG